MQRRRRAIERKSSRNFSQTSFRQPDFGYLSTSAPSFDWRSLYPPWWPTEACCCCQRRHSSMSREREEEKEEKCLYCDRNRGSSTWAAGKRRRAQIGQGILVAWIRTTFRTRISRFLVPELCASHHDYSSYAASFPGHLDEKTLCA